MMEDDVDHDGDHDMAIAEPDPERKSSPPTQKAPEPDYARLATHGLKASASDASREEVGRSLGRRSPGPLYPFPPNPYLSPLECARLHGHGMQRLVLGGVTTANIPRQWGHTSPTPRMLWEWERAQGRMPFVLVRPLRPNGPVHRLKVSDMTWEEDADTSIFSHAQLKEAVLH